MAECWLGLFLFLLVAEALTSNFISIWFALGAFVAMWVSLFTGNGTIQLAIFVVVSFLSLLITKPFVKKIKKHRMVPTNLDAVIGKEGIVTEDIVPYQVGEVKVLGKTWSAISPKKVRKGTLIQVLAIEGVRLVVEKKEEETL